MNTYAVGNLTGSSYGFTVAPSTDHHERPKTPSGLIVTQAVQTRDGWLGQVIVDKEIVWEGDATDDGDSAIQAANARVVQAVRVLFADPAQPGHPERPG